MRHSSQVPTHWACAVCGGVAFGYPPGVDGCSLEGFEKDLKNNLYTEPFPSWLCFVELKCVGGLGGLTGAHGVEGPGQPGLAAAERELRAGNCADDAVWDVQSRLLLVSGKPALLSNRFRLAKIGLA